MPTTRSAGKLKKPLKHRNEVERLKAENAHLLEALKQERQFAIHLWQEILEMDQKFNWVDRTLRHIGFDDRERGEGSLVYAVANETIDGCLRFQPGPADCSDVLPGAPPRERKYGPEWVACACHPDARPRY